MSETQKQNNCFYCFYILTLQGQFSGQGLTKGHRDTGHQICIKGHQIEHTERFNS